ncbi:MAG: ribosome small subunit-dependent GTPase A [Flavobacteriales bacterium]|nr:ribosome small subunit-dependent GTPase A [Flavobacteriales bacterium]
MIIDTKTPFSADLKEGVVLRTAGLLYTVFDGTTQFTCRLAGKVRLEGIKATNPVAVGDKVVFDSHTLLIQDILPRKNYILRESANLSKRYHILAANIDLLALVLSYKQPRTSTGFADRVLATCEAYSVEPFVVFNKKDIWDAADQSAVQEWAEVYKKLGYGVCFTSAFVPATLGPLLEAGRGKTVLFLGHSGAGKSSLLNAMFPNLQLKTAPISRKFEKGRHTTTFAEMFITSAMRVIDTPGIKEFGMVRMRKQEVGDYFREILALKNTCRFHDCLHENEPGCAVREAVEEGEIAFWRYENYLNILHTCTYEPWKDE